MTCPAKKCFLKQKNQIKNLAAKKNNQRMFLLFFDVEVFWGFFVAAESTRRKQILINLR